MEENTITIKNANKKWIKSTIVRGIGMAVCIMWGVLSTVLDSDTWSGAIILFIGSALAFILVIGIPDKILFGKDLRKKKSRVNGSGCRAGLIVIFLTNVS